MNWTLEHKAISRRIREAREAAGISASNLARSLGVTRGAVSQWEQNRSTPKGANLTALAQLLGVSLEWLMLGSNHGKRTQASTEFEVLADCELVDHRKLRDVPAKLIRSALGGRDAEIWCVISEKMIGAGHRPGDHVVVDLLNAAQPRDVVLAEVNGTPILRLFLPPYLFATPIHGSEPHLVINNVDVIVRGVVRGHFPRHSLS